MFHFRGHLHPTVVVHATVDIVKRLWHGHMTVFPGATLGIPGAVCRSQHVLRESVCLGDHHLDIVDLEVGEARQLE